MASDRAYYLLGFRIVGDFGVTIAVPVVALTLLGKWLDARWGTAPWMLIIGFVIAAALTTLLIRRKAKAYADEYKKLIDKKP